LSRCSSQYYRCNQGSKSALGLLRKNLVIEKTPIYFEGDDFETIDISGCSIATKKKKK
jgi:hypothetical protein